MDDQAFDMNAAIDSAITQNPNPALPAAAAQVGTPPAASPDDAANQAKIAKGLNVPTPVVALDPEGAKQELDNRSLWDTIKDDWGLTRAYNNGSNVDIARDDADKMKELFEGIRRLQNEGFSATPIAQTDFGQSLYHGYIGAEYGTLAAQHMMLKKTGQNDATLPLLEEYEKSQQAYADRDAQSGVVANTLGQLLGAAGHDAGGIFMGAAVGAGGGGAAGALINPLAAVPGAVIGGTAGGWSTFNALSAAQTTGRVYRMGELMKDRNGNDIPESVRTTTALSIGAATFGINMLGGKLFAPVVEKAMIRLVGTPLVNYALTANIQRGVQSVGVGGLWGAVAAGIQAIGGESLKAGGKLDEMFPDAASRQAAADQIVHGFVGGAILGGAFHMATEGLNAFSDGIREIRARQLNEFLKEAGKTRDQSKTAERDPQVLQQMLTHATDEGAVTVGITPDSIPEGTVPPGATQAQVDRARETGADVEMPAGNYLALNDAASRAQHENDIRVNNSLTMNEVEELKQHHDTQAQLADAAKQDAMEQERESARAQGFTALDEVQGPIGNAQANHGRPAVVYNGQVFVGATHEQAIVAAQADHPAYTVNEIRRTVSETPGAIGYQARPTADDNGGITIEPDAASDEYYQEAVESGGGRFNIMQDGQPIVDLNLSVRDDGKTLYVDSISRHGHGIADYGIEPGQRNRQANTLGASTMRNVLRALRARYPNAERVQGWRVSGGRNEAREKAREDNPLPVATHEDLLDAGFSPEEAQRVTDRAHWDYVERQNALMVSQGYLKINDHWTLAVESDKQYYPDEDPARIDRAMVRAKAYDDAYARQTAAANRVSEDADIKLPPAKPAKKTPLAAQVEPTEVTHDFVPIDSALDLKGAVPAVKAYGETFTGATHEAAWAKALEHVKTTPAGKGVDEDIAEGYTIPEEHYGFLVPRTKAVTAASRAVAAARNGLYLNQIFKNGEAAGMTPGQFRAYSKRVMEQQTAMEKAVFEAEERQAKREQTAPWKADAKEALELTTQQIKNLPVHQADEYFRSSTLPDGSDSPTVFKMNAAVIDAYFTKEESLALFGREKASAGLPKSYTLKKNGASPDDLAELFGFETGKDMVTELIRLRHDRDLRNETPAQYIKREAQEEAGRVMEALHGNLEDNIFNVALDAMLSKGQIDFLSQEVTQLSLLAGQEKVTAAQLQARIADNVENFSGGAVALGQSVGKLQRLVARQGRNTEAALLRGDYAKAFIEKQRQAINVGILAAARKQQRDGAKFDKLIKKYQKADRPKDRLPHISAVIQDILGTYGLRTRANAGELMTRIREGGGVEKLNEDLLLGGIPLDLPDFVLHLEAPASGAWGVKDFTPGEFQAFMGAIKQLDMVAKSLQQVVVDGQRRDMNQFLDEYVHEMQRLPDLTPDRVPSFVKAVTSVPVHYLRLMDSSMLQMEQLIDWMDGDLGSRGPMNRAFLQPLKASEAKENDLLREFKQHLVDLNKAVEAVGPLNLGERLKNDTIIDYETGKPRQMTRDDLISLMLNMGNTSSYKKLTGAFESPLKNDRTRTPVHNQIKEGDLQAFVDANVRPQDLVLVQGILDMFSKLEPMADGVKYRMTGTGLPLLERRPIVTAAGTIKGGYYPLVPDANWRGVGSSQPTQSMFGYVFTTPAPVNRYTLERTGAIYPLHLGGNMTTTIGTLVARAPSYVIELQKMIHDISFRESVHQANRIASTSEFMTQVDARFGPEYTGMFKPYLDNIANPNPNDPRQEAGFEWLMGTARKRLVAVQMTARASTLVKHTASLATNSMAEAGIENAAQYLATAFARLHDPRYASQTLAMIRELSGFMRGRELTWDRDLAMEARSIQGASGIIKAKAWWNAHGNYFLYKADQYIANIQWLAMFQHGTGKLNMSRDEAVAWADKAVRRAHGDGGVTHLPSIMRGSEMKKILTIAFQVFNERYNRLRNAGFESRRMKEDYLAGEAAKGTARLWRIAVTVIMSTTVSGVIHDLLLNNPHPKRSMGGQLWNWTWHGAIGVLPGAREFPRIWEGQDSDTPIAALARQGSLAYKDAAKWLETGKLGKKAIKNFVTAGAYLLNLGGGAQLGITAQASKDMYDGREKPDGVLQTARTLASGKPHAPVKKEPFTPGAAP